MTEKIIIEITKEELLDALTNLVNKERYQTAEQKKNAVPELVEATDFFHVWDNVTNTQVIQIHIQPVAPKAEKEPMPSIAHDVHDFQGGA